MAQQDYFEEMASPPKKIGKTLREIPIRLINFNPPWAGEILPMSGMRVEGPEPTPEPLPPEPGPKSPGPREPEAQVIVLEKLQGDGGEGLAGRCLWRAGTREKEILRVKATDQSGAPVAGVPLSFEIVSGGGFFVETPGYSTVTNGAGEAAVHYHLGMTTGENKVKVSVLGDSAARPVEFTLTGRLPVVTLDGLLPSGTGDLVNSGCRDIFKLTVRDWRQEALAEEQARMSIVKQECARIVR